MKNQRYKSIAFSEPVTPFQSIKDAATVTGLSQKYLRKGVTNGELPHIRVGAKYMINVPALLDKLNAQSKKDLMEA